MIRRGLSTVSGALAVAIFFFAACGGSDEQANGSSAENTEPPVGGGPTRVGDLPADIAADLVGTEWTLVSLYGDAPLDGTNINLNINDDRVEGSTGCNYYGSNDVIMDEGDLRIGRNQSTTIGCEEAIRQQEEAYLRALNSATYYRVQNGRLEMQDAAGETILAYAAK